MQQSSCEKLTLEYRMGIQVSGLFRKGENSQATIQMESEFLRSITMDMCIGLVVSTGIQ